VGMITSTHLTVSHTECQPLLFCWLCASWRQTGPACGVWKRGALLWVGLGQYELFFLWNLQSNDENSHG
jgi:hypothetical protein